VDGRTHAGCAGREIRPATPGIFIPVMAGLLRGAIGKPAVIPAEAGIL